MANTAPNICDEVWKDIPGWEGCYQASSLGRIRSLGRTIKATSRWGSPQNYFRPGKVLKLKTDKHGYLCCHLNAAGKSEYHLAHRLVCMAFYGPSELTAAHGNGDRQDNRSANLRWATAKENFHDRKSHGTWPEGEASGQSLLTAAKVKKIREAGNPKMDQHFADKFGVSRSTIYAARRGYTWRHI